MGGFNTHRTFSYIKQIPLNEYSFVIKIKMKKPKSTFQFFTLFIFPPFWNKINEKKVKLTSNSNQFLPVHFTVLVFVSLIF